jgi:hypothetical protein
VEPIREPTLFQLEETQQLASELKTERPFSLPGILLGTSAFTANGWEGSFYPKGMRSTDYLAFYATQFSTVEVDSTFYGCPSARTVNNWAARTPEDFVFSVKAPQLCGDENYVAIRSERQCFQTVLDFVGHISNETPLVAHSLWKGKDLTTGKRIVVVANLSG